MAKNLKLKIKNTQLAKAAGLDKFKAKLSGVTGKEGDQKAEPKAAKEKLPESEEEKPRRIRAKSKSSFAPKEELSKEAEEEAFEAQPPVEETLLPSAEPIIEIPIQEEIEEVAPPPAPLLSEPEVEVEKLGPTGRHVKDLLPKREKEKAVEKEKPKEAPKEDKSKVAKPTVSTKPAETEEELRKSKKIREFKDLKPARKGGDRRAFDARDRAGLSEGDDDRWRKRRPVKQGGRIREEQIIRPTSLKVRLPITIKDLASLMKLKASELIQKLFLQGLTYTLNDLLDDENTVQYLGSDFGCAITIDTSEAERIQITSRSIREEIAAIQKEQLQYRPPVVAFMGHVDHGKTSLIDSIRKSNIASGEAGAITQHIGAFRCSTPVGDLTILDTPGHEAFSSMRARGADVTDIVVLVVAGDEGMRDQTLEAIQHAKDAQVTIVVALNKCDKPNFNAENVYRQLSEVGLLPESWGGETITVNTSATTGEGINTLLEMLALQAEVLELKADPLARARGTVLESELHKGLGSVATVLVQNGTLRRGDALVFERHWGRIKTMHDEYGALLDEAGPSTPVEITGLSGLPSAGDPFIAVANEKEARQIVEAREVGIAERALQQKKPSSLDKFLQKGVGAKKILKLILRADVQGSLEALKTSLLKIESDKAQVEIIFTGVGEVSESDIQLAAASNAVIIGFHTAIESHAESLIKEHRVTVHLFDVIYHAIDDVKALMTGLLDKIEEEKETGKAEVKTVFKSSHLGAIAGCQVIEGTISRNHRIRVARGDEIIWKGSIASIKRIKEDVKEVKKGFECGILLDGFTNVQEGDILQAYEIIYLTQTL